MIVTGRDEGLWLQARDLEILAFCLEMKFADIEALNEKFFDPKSHEKFAARKRVQKLEACGYLKSIAMLSGSAKKYYLTTRKGHRELLKADGGERPRPKPVTKLSVVTFEHDLYVLRARLLLEKQGRVRAWRSERCLKTQAEAITGRLARYFLPDAMFTSRQDKVCAFEFENKPKSTVQLTEKIYRLKAVMEQNAPVFEACLVITSSEHLKSKIKTITDNIPNRFIVQSARELESHGQEVSQ